jgi:hypothetical protein
MRKRNQPRYKQVERDENIENGRDFSGPGVIEFSLDLDTDKLRNMSPDELEIYLRGEARRRRNRNRWK